jgi:hypothetical protein
VSPFPLFHANWSIPLNHYLYFLYIRMEYRKNYRRDHTPSMFVEKRKNSPTNRRAVLSRPRCESETILENSDFANKHAGPRQFWPSFSPIHAEVRARGLHSLA